MPADADGPIVVLDPETAFGSGEHGSTRVALSLLERLIQPGDLVLDLGSGSGILALAAVKLGAARAIGIENDPEANVVAAPQRRAQRGRATGRVSRRRRRRSRTACSARPTWSLSNILRSANTALLPAIAMRARPGGTAIFSGMEVDEAPLFLPALESAGFSGPRRADRHGVVGCRRAADMIRVLFERGSGQCRAAGSGLLEGEAHHLRVRRAEDGESVEVRDGDGLVGLGRLVRVGEDLGRGGDLGRTGAHGRRS